MARDHADEPLYNLVDDAAFGEGVYPELDRACNLQLWLYCAGFAITYGSLSVKLWRVKQIYENPTTFVPLL